jgi:S-(hydroxymethyl)glutathione dehydrogenase/alcohol dehydrogenase
MNAITFQGVGDITHTMPLGDAPKGYAIFDRKEDRAIKVMLRP